MILTISGTSGSGKSTIGKILEKTLGWKRIYVGGIRRDLAKEKGLTLPELNEYAKTHPETDVDIDKKVAWQAQEIEKKESNVIVEGRTQYHFLPKSIKIFIKVKPEEGAKRIWKDLQQKETREQRNEGKFTSLVQFKKGIAEREKNDAQRYQKYYGIDYRDESQYDLIIDTTKITAEEATQKILGYLKNLKKTL